MSTTLNEEYPLLALLSLHKLPPTIRLLESYDSANYKPTKTSDNIIDQLSDSYTLRRRSYDQVFQDLLVNFERDFKTELKARYSTLAEVIMSATVACQAVVDVGPLDGEHGIENIMHSYVVDCANLVIMKIVDMADGSSLYWRLNSTVYKWAGSENGLKPNWVLVWRRRIDGRFVEDVLAIIEAKTTVTMTPLCVNRLNSMINERGSTELMNGSLRSSSIGDVRQDEEGSIVQQVSCSPYCLGKQRT